MKPYKDPNDPNVKLEQHNKRITRLERRPNRPDLVAVYDPQSAEEHLYVASTSVAGITAGFLDLARYAGGTFIDLSDTKKAMVTETGVYAASGSVHVFPPASEPAGDGVDFGVTAVQSTIAWPPATPLPGVGTFDNSVLGTGQNDNWFGTASVTAIMQANADWFQVAVDNHNSYAVDVVIALSIVRIIQLS